MKMDDFILVSVDDHLVEPICSTAIFPISTRTT